MLDREQALDNSGHVCVLTMVQLLDRGTNLMTQCDTAGTVHLRLQPLTQKNLCTVLTTKFYLLRLFHFEKRVEKE